MTSQTYEKEYLDKSSFLPTRAGGYFHAPVSLLLPKPMDTLEEQRFDIDDLDDNDVHIGFTNKEYGINKNNPANRSLPQISSTSCIYNDTHLQLVIESITKHSPTKIELCSHHVSINASQTNGILVYEKQLDIYCNISSSNLMMNNCILDTQQSSGLFDVWKSHVSFHCVTFMNGNGNKDSSHPYGGALYLTKATTKMMDCNFVNNSASSGGGIILYASNLS
jgi:hypothetical protein